MIKTSKVRSSDNIECYQTIKADKKSIIIYGLLVFLKNKKFSVKPLAIYEL
jgi:hypothetical protein